jgi:ATP-dependent helicase HrpB
MRTSPDLPITPLLPQITASLIAHPRLVLEAPPGAGKTTQVPLALLDAPWCRGTILLLEPRRIAARAAANFMARQLGEPVGETVGYRIRNESRTSARTRIEVVTEAILTRMLQDDPALDGIDAVLFDEFHERNLHSDLGLALALDAQANLRPELRLVVMSATLEGERLARFLDAPRVTSEGRGFPVGIEHVAARAQESWEQQAARAVKLALANDDGDVLVFLPGKYEIDRLHRVLDGVLNDAATLAVLHGELGVDAQSAVLNARAGDTRRVVLSTNVAESSVTLPGVTAVVDLGLAREPRFDPVSGFSRLETVAISQASATQRAGRAGRVAPGRAYRLWPESQRLEPGLRPELMQVELSPLALELAAWGNADLRWLDAPPPGPLAEARDRLHRLDAIDAHGQITAHGRALTQLGLHPRLAHALLSAPRALKALACDVVALVDARDPLRGESRRNDDLRARTTALARYRETRRAPMEADAHALAQIDRDAADLRRRIKAHASDTTDDPLSVGEILALAFPDRIGRQDPGNPRRYTLANGRGARLADDSRVYGEGWLVASELRLDPRDSLILRAAPVDEAHLRDVMAAHFVRTTTLAFDSSARAVVAHDVESFDDLVLHRRHVPTPRDARSTVLLVDGIRTLGIAALPWTEPLQQWRARAQSLASWVPELDIPALDDDALTKRLDDWLAPYIVGKTKLAEIDAATLGEALHAQLDHTQRRALDEHAPVAITVPTGNSKRLEYVPGQAPVLAVKLQELFGLTEGPRVGRGRIAVTLHLLSPGQRPIQVTQDLKGFWERTYPEVKKELKGRYPRHPWPDDPWSAVPTARAKPRGT